jgi:hypothetical protein
MAWIESQVSQEDDANMMALEDSPLLEEINALDIK